MILYRLLSYLPFTLLYVLAWLAYFVLYHLIGYRRDIVRDNLKNAFPEKDNMERAVLEKKFYRQLTQVAVEIVKARRMDEAAFRKRVHVSNPELLREVSNNFQDSVIVLTIHQGNWEWMLHGTSMATGAPMDPVYKSLHDKAADQLMLEIRSRFGSRPLSLEQSAKDILRHRRQFRFLVMVADQSPIRRERSIWTRFMNQQAAFHPGAENIAKLTGFPVVFAQCRRRRRGHYEIEFHPLATPPYKDSGQAITERYVQMAEQAIRAEPESWLWSNRRWKRNRDADRAGPQGTSDTDI